MDHRDGGHLNAIARKNLLGVGIAAASYDSVTAAVLEAARHRRPLGVSALAVHGVMTGVMDPEHRYRLNQLELLVPDGQPVRWALNLLHGTGLKDRVYGPDLMLRVLESAAAEGLPVCLFGGKPELLDQLQPRLLRQFPGLRIAAAIPSRFRTITADEKLELVRQIIGSGAQLTFVGLGCPRQEVWAYEFREPLSMPVLAVGAAFNFHAGELAQAPQWMQRSGLEWAFRLWREPRRLWQRYLLLNPYYASLVACQWAGIRKFDSSKLVPPREEVRYG
jgi:N-acetylglucosaminyldiphosphoundecaprenol N-acetyl-beta-D-mannosaminyltransferase